MARATDAPPPTVSSTERSPRRYRWYDPLHFIAVHLSTLGALWSGFTWSAFACCLALFWVRMFAITAGYHRYFSHRAFKTSRAFQFVLAFTAETSAQRGVLWWAAHHRRHHRYADASGDPHSPRADGLWYAHVGWIFNRARATTDESRVRDLSVFPELRFLDRFWLLPPVALAVVVLVSLGWSGLFIGFSLSTVFTWHATFAINSLAHTLGRRRFPTADDSRNNLLLALVTLGEGWHNNHHWFMSSARQGFYWWEIDVTYYILKALERLGLVWDLRQPPPRVLAGVGVDQAK